MVAFPRSGSGGERLWAGCVLAGWISLLLGLPVGGAIAQAPEVGRADLRREADAWATRGDSLRTRREADPAIAAYQRAREAYRRLGDSARVAEATGDIGVMHWVRSQYDEALQHFQKALAKARRIGDREEVAVSRVNIGLVHKSRGRYDRALEQYREALAIHREMGNRPEAAVVLNNVGEIYKKRGQLEEALPPLRESLRIHRARKDSLRMAINLTNLGHIYQKQQNFKDALDVHREALAINRAIGSEDGVADALNNLGLVRINQGRTKAALEKFQEALQINQERGRPAAVAIAQNNIGAALKAEGRFEEARAYIERALGTNRTLERTERVARNLENLGRLHLVAGAHATADSILRDAVRHTETLLETATGADRRDFLDQEINRYHALVATQVRKGRPDSALRVLERSRARILAERLADASPQRPIEVAVPPIDSLRAAVGPREAAVLYVPPGPDYPLTALLVTRSDVHAREIASDSLLRGAEAAFEPALDRFQAGVQLGTARAASLVRASAQGTQWGGPSRLARLIHLYRHDVAVPSSEQVLSNERRERLGMYLRNLLVAPLEEWIDGAKSLVVVPDGALGYLPFGLLPDWSGERLIETHDVRYAQSLRTLHLLRRRYEQRREGRAPDTLLAFGGAVYQDEGGGPTAGLNRRRSSTANQTARAEPFDALLDRIYNRLARGVPSVGSYEQLGYGADQWTNLPGTLQEVEALGHIAGTARLLTGERASERTLRLWSRSGRLQDYRVVHFATHGLLSTTVPELSALVLSDVASAAADSSEPGGRGRTDGYVSMREIAALDLNAEFVALSACRTGLGRSYRGSGIVSLAQSFLEAGSASTAVSLWAVYDASTSRFMEEVYRRAWNRETTWAEAMAQTKRAFARGNHGERLRDPRFWAPFVHYGWETK